MTPDRWKKVEEIFESALERAPQERPAYLSDACAGDESLRHQVETLIASYEQAGSFIEAPVMATSEPTLIDPSVTVIGQRIGAYKVVREIGRGGMGSVYLAVRADDEFHKRVAIKLIKRGMDTDFIIRRFRNERQILASLDHPYIGRLLDGGTTEDGLPYFVMEYVVGQPLHDYCDTEKLSIIERLKLFRKVCEAVHYAHHNLIIHRDLKPSNILVTADGTPKLLDFGIAKILNPEIASPTLDPTTAALRMMTPEYASPEQVRGENATVTSDIYSLGVLLYELLTDHRPYRLRSRLPQELARVICEEEPERPSVAVNLIEVIPIDGSEPLEITPETVSKARNTTSEQLRRQLTGSLDSIVLKALRKESHRRYQSVEEFSEDIRRYMEGQPVQAPSFFPASPSGELPTDEPATAARSIAVLPFKMLHVEEKSDEFLGMGMADAIITKISNIHRINVRPTSSVLKYFDGEHNILTAGHELAVGYVLDGRIQRFGDRVRVTLQLVRVRDGAPIWAAKFDERFNDIFSVEDSISEQIAQAIIPRLTGEERELLHKRETDNADAYHVYLKGRYFWNKFTDEGFKKAFECFREASRLDPDYAPAYVGVADYFNWTAIYGLRSPKESFPQAKAAASKALELDDTLAEAHAALGFTMLCYDWDAPAAERLFKRALELNPNSPPAHHWYSNLLAAQGRFNEAIAEMKRAQELNPLSLMDKSMTGWIYYQARQYDAAQRELRKTLEMDGTFGNSYMILGAVYERMGRYEEAIQTLRKSQDLMIGSVVPLWMIGYTLAVAGRRDEAQQMLDHLNELARDRYISPYYFALIHTGLGNKDEAFEWLERAYENRDEWLIWLGCEPKLDELRPDRRFVSLLHRVGIVQEEPRTQLSEAPGRREEMEIETEPVEMGLTSSEQPRMLESQAPPFSHRSRPPGVQTADPSPAHTGEIAPNAPATVRIPGERKPRWWLLPVSAAVLFVVIAAVCLALYNYFSHGQPAVHFQATKVLKLTTSGNATMAAISPDGKYVAYVMDEAGKQGLWVRQVQIANSVPVVPAADVTYRGITYSHDGEYIYYVISDRNNLNQGDLYQVPALGGSVKKLKGDVNGPVSLSPDGKQFAFMRSDLNQKADVLIVASDDVSGARQLASRKYPDHFAWSSAPAWSPDGEVIVCAVESSDSQGYFTKIIAIHTSDGTEEAFAPMRWQYVEQMSWLSDGSGLVIIGQDQDSSFQQIWQISYPSGAARKITTDLSDYNGISLTTNAQALVTVQTQTLSNLWLSSSRDINQATQITSGVSRYFDLSWMPDGRILYATDASGSADIWQMQADGTNQKQLTARGRSNYSPLITPDGRYIVFHSNRTGNWNIYRMDPDGNNLRQLTNDNQGSNWPSVSPDGQWVYYHHVGPSGLLNLWKVSIDNSEPVRITDQPSMHPSVSPKQGLIACWYSQEQAKLNWRLAVLPPDGGTPIKVFDMPSTVLSDSPIRWTPDERALTYIDNRNGASNIWSQPLDGGPPRQLTNFKGEQIYSFDWSKDGKLIISRGLKTTDVVLITDAK